jgi:outer membrane protein TolC
MSNTLIIGSIFFAFLGFMCCPNVVNGQQTLSQSDVIDSTLAYNFGIQVARKQSDIAQNNARKENVGYMPTVNGSLGGNYTIGGSSQKFGNGNENVVKNAASLGGNASVAANYVLFDVSRKYTLQQLNEILSLSNLQLRSSMELNVLQIMATYFEVARLSANISLLEETIQVSQRRLTQSEINFQYGKGNRLNVLNAQVDLQRDSINLMNTQQALNNGKQNLNAQMGRAVDREVRIDTTITYLDNLNLNNLLEDSKSQNVDLLINRKNQDINRIDFDLAGASRTPVISSTLSYSYSFQDNSDDAFITSSNNRGWGVGVNASWNIYDGGRRKIQEQNAIVNLDIQRTLERDLTLQIEKDLRNAWNSYQNALIVLKTEVINVNTSRLNFERTQELFNAGQVTSVEFRQAQVNLINARFSLSNARYSAKMLEYEVLQLSGNLLQ